MPKVGKDTCYLFKQVLHLTAMAMRLVKSWSGRFLVLAFQMFQKLQFRHLPETVVRTTVWTEI
ncbi:unnamed protein product [Coffea canephora]|uniref:DH200=94 genomic scaffold, scaffold_171 n=1 Tax=Coffea canephora TaxID=49390 RepID=A0A068VD90_COFCA|nr:unnamed protein product [Coffea canephora]